MSILDFARWARNHGYINERGHLVAGNATVLHYIKVMEHIQSLMDLKIEDISPADVERGQKFVEKYLKTA